MHRHEVEAECYRYEAWPGQACKQPFACAYELSHHHYAMMTMQVRIKLVKWLFGVCGGGRRRNLVLPLT